MQLAKGTLYIPHQILKRGDQRLMAGHEHIIMPGTRGGGHHMPNSLTQTAANAITHHRVSNFFCDGEANTNCAGITAITALHQATADTCPPRFCSGEEVTAFTEAIQGRRTSGEDDPRWVDPIRADSVGCPVSGRQTLAAVRTAGSDDLAAAASRHARTEAVTALAHELAGLIGALHGYISGLAD